MKVKIPSDHELEIIIGTSRGKCRLHIWDDVFSGAYTKFSDTIDMLRCLAGGWTKSLPVISFTIQNFGAYKMQGVYLLNQTSPCMHRPSSKKEICWDRLRRAFQSVLTRGDGE